MRGVLSIVGIIVLVLIGFSAFNAMFTVHQTQQALVLQFGNPKRVVTEPGLKFKYPWIQNVIYLEKRILAYDAPKEEVIAADQKRLVVDAFARYRIKDPLKFYQTVGDLRAVNSRLQTVLNSSLRRVLGSQEFAAVLTGERATLMLEIRDHVNEGTDEFGIEIVDVRIKRADLPQENSEAIFRRMQTERQREAKELRAEGFEEALRIRSRADKERTVLIAEAKKQSEILRGQGEAERARIFNEAAGQDVDFYSFYRSLQAYRAALQSGDTTMVLSPDSDFFRYFGDIAGTAPVQ